jgi:tetratricopeptide (TPR) repeat protein
MGNSPPIIQNRYHLHKEIGRGGMGVVYLADDRLTGREVALKQVTLPVNQLQFATILQELNQDREADARLALAREFQTLASLRHPHIISVLDFGFAAGQPFFTMDYLATGQPLNAYGRNKPLEDQIDLLLQLLQALAYLYRREILHRDLKPDNVQVVAGRVKVLDFGLAISPEKVAAAGEETTGTLAYMAPELLLGEPASVAADLFAFGVMVYELFAGRHPFDTSSTNALLFAILHDQPDLTRLPPLAPLQELITGLLQKEKTDRLQDLNAIIRLLCAAGNLPPPTETISIRESYLQAAKFVGREDEQQTLLAALDQALSGRGSTWLVAGESGVGKSRLLDEIRTPALVAGAHVLLGQAIAEGGQPFQLWRDLLRRLLLLVAPDDLTAQVLKTIVPDIAHLLGREVADPPPQREANEQKRISAAIVSLFQQLDRPVVLLLEDLHWSHTSLEPLAALVPLTARLPLLILGTFRDDETPDLPGRLPGAQLLKLSRLPVNAVSELSVAILGPAGREAPLVSFLQRETEGNVFFVVEVLRALAEEAGRLADIAHMQLPQRVVAGGIQQIVQRRLQRLPAVDRPLLPLAAVAGRQVDLPVLRRLAASQGIEFEQWLVSAADAAILEVHDGQWRFAHDQLRQGALDELTIGALPEMHRQVAQAIEAVYPQDETQALALVEHWHQAGNSEREARYALPAIEQCLIGSSFARAAQIARRVLPAETNAQRKAGLLRQLGETTHRLGDYAEAKHVLEQGLTLAQETGQKQLAAHFLLDLGVIAANQNNYTQQLAYFQQALTVTRAGDNQELLARNLHDLGMATGQLGDFAQAERYYQQSLAIGREQQYQWVIAACSNGLGWLATLRGDYAFAGEHITESLASYRAIGDRRGAALALNNLGSVARFFGDYTAAQDYYAQGLAIRQEIGVKWGIAASLLNLGVIARLQGDPATAYRHLQDSLAIWQELGVKWGIAQTRLNFGLLNQQVGDYATARQQITHSLALYREIHDEISTALAFIQIGFLDLAAGEPTAAHDRLQEGLQIAAKMGNIPHMLEAIIGLARYFLAIGNPQRSAELVGLVNGHPALSAEIRTARLEPLQAELPGRLSPPELHSAHAQGAALALDAVVQNLLADE